MHNINQNYKPNYSTWGDEIGEIFKSRGMKIKNKKSIVQEITTNKTIMDFAIYYIQDKNKLTKVIQIINHVRLLKQMLLPCKLVGFDGRKRTYEMKHDYEKSCIKWKMTFLIVTKPSKKSIDQWKEFTQWLSQRQITTVYDFGEYAIFKYEISKDSSIIKVKEENHESCYIRIEQKGRDPIYRKVNGFPSDLVDPNNIYQNDSTNRRNIYVKSHERNQRGRGNNNDHTVTKGS